MDPDLADALIQAMLEHPHEAERIAEWAAEEGNLDSLAKEEPEPQ